MSHGLTPRQAYDVGTGELEALLHLLRGLTPAEWEARTDCTGWSVRDVVAHVAGAMEEWASVPTMVRHLALCRRRHPEMSQLDAINAMQVEDRAGASPQQLLDELAAVGPRALDRRRKLPRPLRAIPVPGDSGLPPGARFGYLADVIYPRDLWMHRLDVERATGRAHAPTTSEQTVLRLVGEDLSSTWTDEPLQVELTGPAGGTWQLGPGPATSTVELDALELCRMLSGRPADLGPAGTTTSAMGRLAAARVPF